MYITYSFVSRRFWCVCGGAGYVALNFFGRVGCNTESPEVGCSSKYTRQQLVLEYQYSLQIFIAATMQGMQVCTCFTSAVDFLRCRVLLAVRPLWHRFWYLEVSSCATQECTSTSTPFITSHDHFCTLCSDSVNIIETYADSEIFFGLTA